MRMSDWSSGVCSSDLHAERPGPPSCSAPGRLGHERGQCPAGAACLRDLAGHPDVEHCGHLMHGEAHAIDGCASLQLVDRGAQDRSEEHTSELQSLMRTSYAVFCLKKKNTQWLRPDK